jgi:hypothetical protein
MKSASRLLAWMLALPAVGFACAAVAASTIYDNDALGRLIQLEIPSLNSVQAYIYDPEARPGVGNVTRVPSNLTDVNVTGVGCRVWHFLLSRSIFTLHGLWMTC